tara:strand:+ start:10730 stop:11899 length:1170 start_codon:yes stop_codon:yes gene_type:complete
VKSRCPACDQSEEFFCLYSATQIPTQSCLLVASQREAQSTPRADLCLVSCSHCGFIFNQLFDTATTHYRPGYEDQQRFSSTFNQFSAQLVKQLGNTYSLSDKTIVEVGCGKGDFLVELCTAVGAAGVGIDPAWQEDRTAVETGHNVRFVRDSLKRENIPANPALILCRHTLEHIEYPLAFMRTVRECIKDNTPVFLEVPDATRILESGSFEDIYYEHCNYFTAAALERLLENSGFTVRESYRVYDDQYLCIEAIARPENTARPAENAALTANEQDSIARFKPAVSTNIQHWSANLATWSERQESVAIWGSGSKCVAFLSALPIAQVHAIVDINPYRSGLFAPGTSLPISTPDALTTLRPDRIVLMNALYRQEVAQMLLDLGVATHISVL